MENNPAWPYRVVMVYIEPTPYIVALIGTLRRIHAGSIEANYITINSSQPWKLHLENELDRVLPAGFFAQILALRAVLDRDRSRTILQLAGWGHPVLVGALLMASLLRIPVVVESDTAGGRSAHDWREWLKQLLYPIIFRLPRRFLPGGTRQADYLARFGVKPPRITIAQMTVDVCAIRRFCVENRERARSETRARWGIPSYERIALFVGRLEEEKGLNELLSAFDRAVAAERDLRLAIVGDGSLRKHIETVAADADRRIIYLGRLSGDDVWRAYLAVDLLVLPSLFEPWGLVVNEAMACGLPVIVSDRVGCVDDLVRQGETGLVVGAGREAELTAAILELTGKPQARRQMGQAAEQLISHWTLQNEAHNIVRAWDEIIR